MKPVMLFVALLIASTASFAADDFKLSQVELAVRNLQQEVRSQQQELRAQSQKIEELTRQIRPAAAVPAGQPAFNAGNANADNWLDAMKWQSLQVGMNEMKVIEVLGPPTSMRAGEQERVLLYAMEIGTSGFLSGSVTLRDRIVIRIEKPVLR